MNHLSFRVMLAMEYLPNSRPKNIWASALQRATLVWYEPCHISFITKPSRLQTYTHWSHGMYPSPNALSEAGFLFTGNHFIF